MGVLDRRLGLLVSFYFQKAGRACMVRVGEAAYVFDAGFFSDLQGKRWKIFYFGIGFEF